MKPKGVALEAERCSSSIEAERVEAERELAARGIAVDVTEPGFEVCYCVRMVKVKEGEPSDVSEVQFRLAAHEAPTGNIPPLLVDSHEAGMSPHFAWPPGEGKEAESTHSLMMVGRTGYIIIIHFIRHLGNT